MEVFPRPEHHEEVTSRSHRQPSTTQNLIVGPDVTGLSAFTAGA
jgi:hypothetical protein